MKKFLSLDDNINLGELPQGKTAEISFQGIDTDKVYRAEASCGCTKPNIARGSNIIKVLYKPKKVPIHLAHQGFYKATQRVYLYLKDGTRRDLSLTAKITK